MPLVAPGNHETALSFRAKRGISLCAAVRRSPKNQSEIPRFARNDSAFSMQRARDLTGQPQILCPSLEIRSDHSLLIRSCSFWNL